MDTKGTMTCVVCGLAFFIEGLHVCSARVQSPTAAGVVVEWKHPIAYRDSDPHVPESKYPFENTDMVTAGVSTGTVSNYMRRGTGLGVTSLSGTGRVFSFGNIAPLNEPYRHG